MTATDTDPRQELAALEARILAGDETVTAAALQKARAAVDLAELQDSAAQRRAAEQAAAERAETEAKYRAELDAQLAQLAEIQAAYAAAVESLRTLNRHVDTWQHRRFERRPGWRPHPPRTGVRSRPRHPGGTPLNGGQAVSVRLRDRLSVREMLVCPLAGVMHEI